MANRQSFDLKTKIGIKNAIERRFDKWTREHVLKDTFMNLWCKIIGHVSYMTDDNEHACKRCGKYIRQSK